MSLFPTEEQKAQQRGYERGYAAGAKSEREQVLKELEMTVSDCDVGGNCSIIKKIESLRAQQAGEP